MSNLCAIADCSSPPEENLPSFEEWAGQLCNGRPSVDGRLVFCLAHYTSSLQGYLRYKQAEALVSPCISIVLGFCKSKLYCSFKIVFIYTSLLHSSTHQFSTSISYRGHLLFYSRVHCGGAISSPWPWRGRSSLWL